MHGELLLIEKLEAENAELRRNLNRTDAQLREALELEKFYKDRLGQVKHEQSGPRVPRGLGEVRDMTDPVFHPKHYINLGIECIDMIYAVSTLEEFLGYCRGCALKYRFRAGEKGDALEDIAKAKQYERWFELVASGEIGDRKPSETVEVE